MLGCHVSSRGARTAGDHQSRSCPNEPIDMLEVADLNFVFQDVGTQVEVLLLRESDLEIAQGIPD